MEIRRQNRSVELARALLLALLLCLWMPFSAAPDEVVDVTIGADIEVKEFQLEELEARVHSMPPGPVHDYFAGVLANRAGRSSESIRLLNRALPGIRTPRPDRAATALEALADDYNKSFRYADAAETCDDLLIHFASELGPGKLPGTKDDCGLMHLLREAPAQTIVREGSTRLNTERNSLGSLNTLLTVNGVRERWLLDTGANLSVVSRSLANRLGLRPLPGTGQTRAGVTGI